MGNFLIPLLWALGLLLAMAGIGCFAGRMILRVSLPLGIATALGFAITASVGAMANLTQLISRPAMLVYVLLGLTVLALHLLTRRAFVRSQAHQFFRSLRGDRALALLLAACFLLAGLRLAGTVRENSFITEGQSLGLGFNIHDDFQAYFVFPNKMLQTGTLGRDPFSERRLVTSLGGSYLWDCALLTELPEENLHLLDDGLGFLLLLWVTADLLVALDLPQRLIPVILLLLLAFPPASINITSSLIPAALLLSLIGLYLRPPAPLAPWRESLIAALLAAAIAAAKSTFIIPLILFLITFHLLSATRHETTRIKAPPLLLTIAFTVLLLLPWLVSFYSSFGSPFNLLFGPEALLRVPSSGPPLPTYFHFLVPLLLLAGCLILRRLASPKEGQESTIQNLLIALLLAWLAALFLLFRTATSSDIARLAFPFMLAGTAFSLAAFAWLLTSATTTIKNRRSNITMVLAAALGVFVLLRLPAAISFYAHTLPLDLYAGYVNTPLIDQNAVAAAQSLQAAAPSGAVILARLAYPFLLDFQRNPILIIDQPGGYYFAPREDDIPQFQGPGPLRQYLLDHHIRYVAWSYASQANFPYAHFASRLNDPDPRLRNSARCTFDFQSNLETLRRTSRILYQDDQNALFDLSLNN